jgi:CRISPR-associated protein Csx17
MLLEGCRPAPLASYLKALGVLRLVAEQVDSEAAGFWKGERFHLRSGLDREALRRFFFETYAPTPIIAPWNGGSGFYPKDAKEGIAALATAKAPRFAPYKAGIELGCRLIAAQGLGERPTDAAKTRLIGALRAEADEGVLAWVDAAVALTLDKTAFPPLLGTGGNDGRLDFTNNFMQRLAELFNTDTGAATVAAQTLLDSALFGSPTSGLASVAIGQFAPGAAGGPNASAGYEGPGRVNAWDFVLMLEGALVFGGGVSRRFEGADVAYLSYPFTVRATAAGFGTASLIEQAESRGEIWAPLWERPTALAEIRLLFREGRLSLGARPARDGLDAARAVAGLGADRRIAAFERYGFVKRQGLAYLAAPLGRRVVKPNPAAELATDLDRGRWLESLRREAAASEAPAGIRAAARALEEALFELTAAASEPRSVQAVLVAIGAAARALAERPKLWERLRPPPRLQADWLRKAYDGTSEFRIAAALASLYAEEVARGAGPEGAVAARPPASRARQGEILPMRAHFAPLDRRSASRWDPVDGTSAFVWGTGSLVSNLCAVAVRRLLEQDRNNLTDKPFAAFICVSSGDIAAFIAGDPAFDRRVATLLAGLVWVRQASREQRGELFEIWDSPVAPLPLAYAVLKPLLSPAAALRRLNIGLPKQIDLPIPPPLPGLLTADRVEEAVRLAMVRARGSGLPTPFMDARPRFRDGRRLLAALLIPVRAAVLDACFSQAFPFEKET